MKSKDFLDLIKKFHPQDTVRFYDKSSKQYFELGFSSLDKRNDRIILHIDPPGFWPRPLTYSHFPNIITQYSNYLDLEIVFKSDEIEYKIYEPSN